MSLVRSITVTGMSSLMSVYSQPLVPSVDTAYAPQVFRTISMNDIIAQLRRTELASDQQAGDICRVQNYFQSITIGTYGKIGSFQTGLKQQHCPKYYIALTGLYITGSPCVIEITGLVSNRVVGSIFMLLQKYTADWYVSCVSIQPIFSIITK